MSSAKSPVPLSTVLTDLEKAEQQATEIVAGLSQRQANWQPDARSWSIVQCLTHLTRINQIYAGPMQEAVLVGRTKRTPLDTVGISPGWFGAWFIRTMEPPVRTRMRTPKKALPATAAVDPREALGEFISSHDAVRAVVEGASRLDLNNVRFKNPFIGLLRFTVGTGLLIITAHDRRHLWQARKVREAPGFPQR
jgi:hypothetical protein